MKERAQPIQALTPPTNHLKYTKGSKHRVESEKWRMRMLVMTTRCNPVLQRADLQIFTFADNDLNVRRSFIIHQLTVKEISHTRDLDMQRLLTATEELTKRVEMLEFQN